MSRRTKIRGFTLVELLVVISIIGMLMSLLLPAVQSARESGRRAVCLNNINQLSLAAINYEQTKRRFPGYQGSAPAGPDGVAKRITWPTALLPYMDRSDLWDQWNSTSVNYSAVPVVTIESFTCPSDTTTTTTEVLVPHPLSYVANSGRTDVAVTATETVPDRPSHGAFLDQVTAPNTILNIDAITDGTTNTLLFGENLQAQEWTMKFAETPAPTPNQIEARFGFVWSFIGGVRGNTDETAARPGDYLSINQDKTAVGVPDMFHARPSSNHPGGCNFAFADRQTRFIREDINYHVYRQLMTPRGRESDSYENARLSQTGSNYLTTPVLDAAAYQ